MTWCLISWCGHVLAIDVCETNNGGCEDKCEHLAHKEYRCVCETPGYVSSPDDHHLCVCKYIAIIHLCPRKMKTLVMVPCLSSPPIFNIGRQWSGMFFTLTLQIMRFSQHAHHWLHTFGPKLIENRLDQNHYCLPRSTIKIMYRCFLNHHNSVLKAFCFSQQLPDCWNSHHYVVHNAMISLFV